MTKIPSYTPDEMNKILSSSSFPDELTGFQFLTTIWWSSFNRKRFALFVYGIEKDCSVGGSFLAAKCYSFKRNKKA